MPKQLVAPPHRAGFIVLSMWWPTPSTPSVCRGHVPSTTGLVELAYEWSRASPLLTQVSMGGPPQPVAFCCLRHWATRALSK